MSDKYKYTAFISYSHADKKAVSWLHRSLEKYRIPKNLVGRETPFGPVPGRFQPFFRDREDLSAATNLTSSIKKALAQSRFLIVVCSPGAANSPWVAKEIMEFKRLRKQGNILCIIVDGDAGSGAQLFPKALWEGLSAKNKKSYEPVAADARPGGDGKKLAKLKLISGLLGIELDTLIQRESRRRYIQLGIASAASFSLVIVLSVLLYLATQARKEAEANRLIAEDRQFQAEELIDYMLGDLREKLAPIGSLEIMDSIAIRALGYYASLDPESMTTEALSQRANVLLMLGEVQDQSGNFSQAKSAFQEAFATTEELLSRDRTNQDLIFGHSQSVFWLAYLDLKTGNLDGAERQFRQYAEYAKELADIDPDNVGYRMEVGYAHSNLGTLYYNRARFNEAEKEFEQQLDIFQTLYEKDPTDSSIAYDLGQSYAWLSDSQLASGSLSKALENRQKEAALYENLLTQSPQNLTYQRGLLVSYQRLMNLNSYLGRAAPVVSYFQNGMATGERLISYDPENTWVLRQFAWLILDYIEAIGFQKPASEMAPYVKRAKTITGVLVGKNPDSSEWQMLHQTAQLSEAIYLFRQSKIDEGLEVAGPAHQALMSIWREEPENHVFLESFGFSALTFYQGLTRAGNSNEAQKALEVFVESTEKLEPRMRIRGKDFLSRARQKLNQTVKAQQTRDFLIEIGYAAPDFKNFWQNEGLKNGGPSNQGGKK